MRFPDPVCDLCGRASAMLFFCDERHVAVCTNCLVTPGRLGGGEHRMPGGEVICAHRRKDSVAARLAGAGTVLYRAGAS